MTNGIRNATLTLGILATAIAGQHLTSADPVEGQVAREGRVYELRTYTTPEGKLPNLLARFRDHTMRIFERHGMTNVGYWVPMDQEDTLIYIISHGSRAAADANWEAFRSDPEWQRVSEESQREGPIVTNVERVFMTATDFSPID
jgi:hypothetical protein